MSVERTFGQPTNNFETPQERFTVLLDLVSSPRPQEARANFQLADELVRFATEESDNFLPTVQTINKAYECMQAGNTLLGKRIIIRLDEYYKNMGFSYKYLFPNAEDAYEQMQAAQDEYYGYITHEEDKQLFVANTTNNVSFAARVIREQFNVRKAEHADKDDKPKDIPMGIFYVQPRYVSINWNTMCDTVEPVTSAFQEMFLLFYNADKTTRDQQTRLPENLLTKAEEISILPQVMRGKADVLDKEFGGSTIRKLASEKDINRFGYKMLRYLSNLPKNDLFWRHFATKGILHLTDGMDSKTNQPFVFFNPEYSKKLLSFQWWLTQKLLLPVFNEAATDARFDREMHELLRTADFEVILSIGSVVDLQKRVDASMQVHRLPGSALFKTSTYSPFVDIAQASPNTGLDTHPLAIQYEVSQFFRKNRGQIAENLTARFPDIPHLNTLLNEVTQSEEREVLEDDAEFNYSYWLIKHNSPQALRAAHEQKGKYSPDTLEAFAKEVQIVKNASSDANLPVFVATFPEYIDTKVLAIDQVLLAPGVHTPALKFLVISGNNTIGISGHAEEGILKLFFREDKFPYAVLHDLVTAAWIAYQNMVNIEQTQIEQTLYGDTDNIPELVISDEGKESSTQTETEQEPSSSLSSPDDVAQMLGNLRKQLEQLKGEPSK